MRNIAKIISKEVKLFFTSPAAYIVLIMFLGISGWLFSNTLFIINQSDMRRLFSIIPMVYLVVIPAITMSLISKEKNVGTIELLTTFPIKDHEIIVGKYLAALIMIGVGLLMTLVHLFTIVSLGTNIDFGPIFSGYFGLILLGSAFSAIGVFASTLTKNQVVSLIIAFAISFFFFIIGHLLIFMPSFLAKIFNFVSMRYHMEPLSRGVIDTRNVLYFVSLTVVFLRLAVASLESRKW